MREERVKMRRSIRLFAAMKSCNSPEAPKRKAQKRKGSSVRSRKVKVQKRASSIPETATESDVKKAEKTRSRRRLAQEDHKEARPRKVNRKLDLPSKSSHTDKKSPKSKVKTESAEECLSMSDRTVRKLLQALIHSPFHIQVTTASAIQLNDVQIHKELSIVKLKASVDEAAYSLMPDDVPSNVCTPGRPSFPIVVEGDGNCFSRVGSIILYGTESHHLEVRLRIAIEMIMFRDLYLDEEHLSKGLPDKQRLTPAMVAQFSDNYTMQPLDDINVQTIYLKEVHQVLKPFEYMGTWQLFALASVLKTPIFSAYPHRGNPNVRRDLHRFIMPREIEDTETKPPVILWSSCRSDMNDHHWVPNHVTLMLPVML
jgi:hypothetical protein